MGYPKKESIHLNEYLLHGHPFNASRRSTSAARKTHTRALDPGIAEIIRRSKLQIGNDPGHRERSARESGLNPLSLRWKAGTVSHRRGPHRLQWSSCTAATSREVTHSPHCGIRATRSLLIEIVQTFARHLCRYSDGGAAASFAVRELTTPGSGYSTIYEGFIRDLHAEVTALLGKSTARYPREESTIIDAHALVGAALSFVVARKAFAQRSYRPVDREERVEAIAQRIAEITTRLTEPKFVPRPVRPLPASPLLAPRNRPRKSRTARMKAVAVQGPLADPAPEA